MDYLRVCAGWVSQKDMQTALRDVPTITADNVQSVVVRPVHTQNGHVVNVDFRKDCYTGSVENGLPHGEGKMVYCFFSRVGNFRFTSYQGGFLEGKTHGKGMFIEDTFTMEGQFVDNKPEGIMRICKYRTRKTKLETKYCVYQIEARVLPVLDNQGRILYMEHSMLQHFEGTFVCITDAGEKKSLTPRDMTLEIFNIYPQTGIMHCKNGFVINGTFNIDWRMVDIHCVGIVTHPNGNSVEGTFTVKSMKDLKGLFL